MTKRNNNLIDRQININRDQCADIFLKGNLYISQDSKTNLQYSKLTLKISLSSSKMTKGNSIREGILCLGYDLQLRMSTITVGNKNNILFN